MPLPIGIGVGFARCVCVGSLAPPPIVPFSFPPTTPSPPPPPLRLDSKDNCERAIAALNGRTLEGATEALVIKFADGARKRSSHGT